MGDEATREPGPDSTGAPAEQPHQAAGWQAEPAREWEQRPNHAWQTGAPETWNARPNEAWQTGVPHSWGARPNPLWQGGAASETAPTVPLPAETSSYPTAPAGPPGVAAVYGAPPLNVGAPQPGYPQAPSPQVGAPPLPGSLPDTPPSHAPGQTSPPSYPHAPVPAPAAPRRRTALWLGIGVVVVAVVITLIVMFSIWLGNQAQILWNSAAQPGTTSSGTPAPERGTPAASPSAAPPSSTPTPEPPAPTPDATAPAHEPTGDRVPLDVASALPEGADFTVAPGSTWMDLGSTFLGDENGELWATSLTGIYGEISDEDARAATEALIRVLSAGSTDGVQSVWVSGTDGRSYEFLTAASDGIGVMVRAEPDSGRQFALMFGGTTADVVANLILE
ncbi:hypothetical protein [Microbacterium sp. GXS0129]|uniref:hypothetical protein n=1 Tax=Microbacterium sp. GXS0129 TaxID=3377836 RepID=UPI00383A3A26